MSKAARRVFVDSTHRASGSGSDFTIQLEENLDCNENTKCYIDAFSCSLSWRTINPNNHYLYLREFRPGGKDFYIFEGTFNDHTSDNYTVVNAAGGASFRHILKRNGTNVASFNENNLALAYDSGHTGTIDPTLNTFTEVDPQALVNWESIQYDVNTSGASLGRISLTKSGSAPNEVFTGAIPMANEWTFQGTYNFTSPDLTGSWQEPSGSVPLVFDMSRDSNIPNKWSSVPNGQTLEWIIVDQHLLGFNCLVYKSGILQATSGNVYPNLTGISYSDGTTTGSFGSPTTSDNNIYVNPLDATGTVEITPILMGFIIALVDSTGTVTDIGYCIYYNATNDYGSSSFFFNSGNNWTKQSGSLNPPTGHPLIGVYVQATNTIAFSAALTAFGSSASSLVFQNNSPPTVNQDIEITGTGQLGAYGNKSFVFYKIVGCKIPFDVVEYSASDVRADSLLASNNTQFWSLDVQGSNYSVIKYFSTINSSQNYSAVSISGQATTFTFTSGPKTHNSSPISNGSYTDKNGSTVSVNVNPDSSFDSFSIVSTAISNQVTYTFTGVGSTTKSSYTITYSGGTVKLDERAHSDKIMTVPSGEYTLTTLATALQTLLNTAQVFDNSYTVTPDVNNNSLEISNGKANQYFQILDEQRLKSDVKSDWNYDVNIPSPTLSINKVLGNLTRSFTLHDSNNPFRSNFVKLIPYDSVYLHSNTLSVLKSQGPTMFTRTCIKKISVGNTTFGSILTSDLQQTIDFIDVSNRVFSGDLHFALKDHDNNVIDINGGTISFLLIFTEQS